MKIKTKIGDTEIEVEGKTVSELLDNLNKIREEIQKRNVAMHEVSSMSVTKLLINLIKTGFFDSGKTLNEISSELEKRGFRIKTTTLAPLLIRFVRNNMLEREKDIRIRQYVYHKTKQQTLPL